MRKSLLYGSTFLLLAAFGAGAATISGTVRAASNGGTGAVIADAQVVLYGFGGGGGGLQQALDTTTTNAQGNYEFDSVSTGFKQVVVTKSGYQNGQAITNVMQNSQEIDLDVTMNPTGTGGGNTGIVAGTVRAASSGGAQGAAIANALVVLSRTAGGGPGGAYMDSARTNAQGQFRFDSVPAVNNYVLRVSAAGYNPASNSNVDVDAGDTTTANFTLTAVPGPARPGSIAGTVRKAAGGDAVSGATVVLSRNGARVDSAKTNADGQYAFDSVAANTNYTVTVALTGFQTAVNSDVDVASNQTSTVDFNLIASGSGGTRGSIIGTVVDNSKKAVAKARVILSRSGFGGGSGPIDTVETDASGDFSFDSVAALQNYTVTVTASGFQTAVNNNVDVVAGQAVVADFILVPSGVGIRADGASAFRALASRGALRVEFTVSPWAGRMAAYDARGALAYAAEVPAGAASMSLPVRSGIRFLVLERGGMVEKLSLTAAR